MATYKQDLNLPSHGRRAKADNAGTIRVHITREEGIPVLLDSQAFDYYLNIDTQNGTYHATIEVEKGYPPKKDVTSIEVAKEVLEEVVSLAQNKNFLALNNDNIFPSTSRTLLWTEGKRRLPQFTYPTLLREGYHPESQS